MKELGCNAVRFSVEWATIEPQEGVFDLEVLSFYEQYCEELIKNGITPMITLYHWVHPLWFEQKGGFEKEENIGYFLRFCTTVFQRLSNKVHLWCTINEPTVSSFMGYVLGMHSPGKKGHFTTAGIVLQNLLYAHVCAYQTLKKLPYGQEAHIGIVHQVLKAQAYSPWYPHSRAIAWFLNFCAGHEQVKELLTTGNFNYKIPGLVNVACYMPEAPQSYDFIGINYYSRVLVGFGGPTCLPDEVMTDMEYASFPQGIYDAIADLSQLGVPLYITENGIPDSKDDRRQSFINGYLQSVHKAVTDGYDVRGYFYWTLMDNFEWDRGYSMKFGLYDVDYETQRRTLRRGSYCFRDNFTIQS